jgi:hypothetical protein
LDKSDLQELLAALYLRLNGYLASGCIAHAPVGNLTEIDIIAVRFPGHREPEREIAPFNYLAPPSDRVDFLVGEVNGGRKNANFNPKFREQPDAICKVLHRIGAFSDIEIDRWIPDIMAALKPQSLARASHFPTFAVTDRPEQLRFVLFSPDQTRNSYPKPRPVIFGDDMLEFVWTCLGPSAPRLACATDYHVKL